MPSCAQVKVSEPATSRWLAASEVPTSGSARGDESESARRAEAPERDVESAAGEAPHRSRQLVQVVVGGVAGEPFAAAEVEAEVPALGHVAQVDARREADLGVGDVVVRRAGGEEKISAGEEAKVGSP